MSGLLSTQRQICFVHPFSSGSAIEADRDLFHREMLLFKRLMLAGYEVRALGFHDECSVTQIFRGGTYWEYLPAAALEPQHNQRVCTYALRNSPAVLILKGAGTSLGFRLASQSRSLNVLIVGGRHVAPETDLFDLVLSETPDQMNYFRNRSGIREVIHFPKYISPEFLAGRQMSSEFDFAVVSNFLSHKNHKALLPLASSGHRFVFVGDGPERLAFEAEFRRLKGNAEFTGAIPRVEVAHLLRRSKVLLHPSLSEGFPRAAAEALAAGTPVVGIRGVIGFPVIDGLNGRLVSESELCSAASELIADVHSLDRMSSEARSRGLNEFSDERLDDAIEAVVVHIHDACYSPNSSSFWIRSKSRIRTANALVRKRLSRLKSAIYSRPS